MQCRLVAFAEVLDQFSGIECYSGTAVGLHLQKLWISLVESSVMIALERRSGQPDGVKLALEWRFKQSGGVKLARNGVLGGLMTPSWPWNGVLGALKVKKLFIGSFHDPNAR
mgnify:CR=1 FL=1